MEINLVQSINANVDFVFTQLLDHNNLGRFFNAKITVTHPQNEGEIVGGKGTIRQIQSGRTAFKEQILSVSPEHISYKIIGKAPVSDHQGDIYLTEKVNTETGLVNTHLHYIITCKGPKWIPDFIVKFIIEKDIKQAIKKLALFCEQASTK